MYTVAVWFRVEGGTGQRDILSIYDAAGPTMASCWKSPPTMACGSCTGPRSALPVGDVSNYTYTDGAWYHVAIVKSADAMTLYINGIAAGSAADTVRSVSPSRGSPSAS